MPTKGKATGNLRQGIINKPDKWGFQVVLQGASEDGQARWIERKNLGKKRNFSGQEVVPLECEVEVNKDALFGSMEAGVKGAQKKGRPEKDDSNGGSSAGVDEQTRCCSDTACERCSNDRQLQPAIRSSVNDHGETENSCFDKKG